MVDPWTVVLMDLEGGLEDQETGPVGLAGDVTTAHHHHG